MVEWTTREGKKIPINKLEDSHLINIMRMIESKLHTPEDCDSVFEYEHLYKEACFRGMISMPYQDFLKLKKCPIRPHTPNWTNYFEAF